MLEIKFASNVLSVSTQVSRRRGGVLGDVLCKHHMRTECDESHPGSGKTHRQGAHSAATGNLPAEALWGAEQYSSDDEGNPIALEALCETPSVPPARSGVLRNSEVQETTGCDKHKAYLAKRKITQHRADLNKLQQDIAHVKPVGEKHLRQAAHLNRPRTCVCGVCVKRAQPTAKPVIFQRGCTSFCLLVFVILAKVKFLRKIKIRGKIPTVAKRVSVYHHPNIVSKKKRGRPLTEQIERRLQDPARSALERLEQKAHSPGGTLPCLQDLQQSQLRTMRARFHIPTPPDTSETNGWAVACRTAPPPLSLTPKCQKRKKRKKNTFLASDVGLSDMTLAQNLSHRFAVLNAMQAAGAEEASLENRIAEYALNATGRTAATIKAVVFGGIPITKRPEAAQEPSLRRPSATHTPSRPPLPPNGRTDTQPPQPSQRSESIRHIRQHSAKPSREDREDASERDPLSALDWQHSWDASKDRESPWQREKEKEGPETHCPRWPEGRPRRGGAMYTGVFAGIRGGSGGSGGMGSVGSTPRHTVRSVPEIAELDVEGAAPMASQGGVEQGVGGGGGGAGGEPPTAPPQMTDIAALPALPFSVLASASLPGG